MTTTTPEDDLIRRARRFEQAALAEIYDGYSPGLYRYVRHLLGDARTAEDCLADTFLRFLQALRAAGGPQEHLQAYLYRIAHNWVTDHYRRRPLPPLPLFEDLLSLEGDPFQTLLERIEKEQVRAALLRLTPEQRQVIVLKYLEGWENAAIAQLLEKPVGAVKSLQHRALEALRRMLLPEKEVLHD